MKKITIYPIISVLLLTAPAAVYGGMFDRGPKSDRVRKSTALTKAEQAFLKGDYEETLIICNKYSGSQRKSNDGLQHLAGMALLKLGRFDEARNRFSRILNGSGGDDFLDKAYIGIADSYYLEGNYKKAMPHYERVIRYFPDSDNLNIVYYKLGEGYSKLNDKKSSKKYYDKLLKTYPASLEAKLFIGEKPDFMAYSVQAGSFGKWSNAKKLLDELNKKNFDANIYTALVGNKRFYRVRVGRYNSLDDAESMARTLRNRGYKVKIYP